MLTPFADVEFATEEAAQKVCRLNDYPAPPPLPPPPPHHAVLVSANFISHAMRRHQRSSPGIVIERIKLQRSPSQSAFQICAQLTSLPILASCLLKSRSLPRSSHVATRSSKSEQMSRHSTEVQQQRWKSNFRCSSRNLCRRKGQRRRLQVQGTRWRLPWWLSGKVQT